MFQTVPPTDLRAILIVPDTVRLTWAPVGTHVLFYEFSYATTPGGPFVVHGQAYPDSLTYTVTGLQPIVPYYFRARAFTPAHESHPPVGRSLRTLLLPTEQLVERLHATGQRECGGHGHTDADCHANTDRDAQPGAVACVPAADCAVTMDDRR